MASKTKLLKQGARKTGSGLFDGMSPLSSRVEEASKAVEETPVIEKEEKVTEPVKVEEVVAPSPTPVKEEPVAAPVEEPKPVEVQIQEPVVEEVEAVEEEVKAPINKAEKAEKKPADKPQSRYEKEKFLLLDIRGYRDYVEHMAKAANMSATKYIRNLIQMDMDQHREIYEEHKALEEKLRELWKKSAEK